MPRGPCHFAMLYQLHEAMRNDLPEAADLADRELPEFVAGSVAPDGLRFMGNMGKFATHFYEEGRPETWGRSVSGMFAAHPDIANPDAVATSDAALILGYISHLTVDEAFRDVVTHQVHGMEAWRPLVRGLWSLADEIPGGYADLGENVDRFRADGCAGFIDREVVAEYLDLVRPWVDSREPWEIEQVFLKLTRSKRPEAEAKAAWLVEREKAEELLGETRSQAFQAEAVKRGMEEIRAYLQGKYAR